MSRVVCLCCRVRDCLIATPIPTTIIVRVIVIRSTSKSSLFLQHSTTHMMSCSVPLQELPLAHFLPSGASPSLKTPTIAKPAKRPLSPSKSTIFSPAKRRILRSEGILLPGGSSLSSFRPQLPSCGSDLFGASRASSTASPSPVQRTCVAQGNSKDRRTSRRSSPKLTRQCSTITSGDDSASALSLRRSSRLQSSQPRAAPIAILREMPPLHDRQSVHYPGFDTYQDKHIFLVPSQTIPSSDNEDSWSSSEEVLSESEISKENIPPRKKAKKSSLARSSLPMDKTFRSDRSPDRDSLEGVRQLPDITASSYRWGCHSPGVLKRAPQVGE